MKKARASGPFAMARLLLDEGFKADLAQEGLC
jgi:hypothetical protein